MNEVSRLRHSLEQSILKSNEKDRFTCEGGIFALNTDKAEAYDEQQQLLARIKAMREFVGGFETGAWKDATGVPLHAGVRVPFSLQDLLYRLDLCEVTSEEELLNLLLHYTLNKLLSASEPSDRTQVKKLLEQITAKFHFT